ncbi:hypothetical protein CWI40_040140 [Ordospora colligata]|nr:hypothetical protein CWI40_040140 [Ordospora colligata]
MENNKLKVSTDEDDFWGILSGSDGSEEDEISVLFKSKVSEKVVESDQDVCREVKSSEAIEDQYSCREDQATEIMQQMQVSDEMESQDICNEEQPSEIIEEQDISSEDQASEIMEEMETNEIIQTNFAIKQIISEEVDIEAMDDMNVEVCLERLDDAEKNTETIIESLYEENDAIDMAWTKVTKKMNVDVEDSQKTCSVDDMGLIWDDDEEFVFGASTDSMKIIEQNKVINEPEKMEVDYEYIIDSNDKYKMMNEVCESMHEEPIYNALMNENDEMYHDEAKEESVVELDINNEENGIQASDEDIHGNQDVGVNDKYNEHDTVNAIQTEIKDDVLNKHDEIWNASNNKCIRTVPSCKKMNIMMPKPLVKFICGTVFTVWKSSQKRFNMQGEAVMTSINVSQCYRLDYVIRGIKRSEFEARMNEESVREYRDIYSLLRLKNPCVESIANIVWSMKPVYCESDICWKVEAECINEFFRLCFVDEDKAFEYALEKEMWGFGIMLPNRGQEMKKKAIERMMKPSCIPLVSAAIGEPYSCLKVSGEWKKYIREVLQLKNCEVCHNFIMEVYNCGVTDALFVVLACHIVGIADASKYLWMFSKNFDAIGALCYAEGVGKPIQDLDILKYEFVCVGMEFDKVRAEEYFNANKKCFRKELAANFGPQLDSKWSFGLKSVFDFGIKKILNVDSFEESPSEIPIRHGGLQMPMAKSCFNGNSLSLKEIEKSLHVYDEQESVGLIGTEQSTCSNEKIVEESSKRPAALTSNNENVPLQTPCVSSQSKIESKNEKDKLFVDESPKSFADFFDEQNAACPEDLKDAGAFLSKYAIEEDTVETKEEKAPKKAGGSSFFGFLSMFKKESIHKVNIDVDDDFKYDPIEKKWVGGTTKTNGGETPVMRSRSIPKPSSGGASEQSTEKADESVIFAYANRRRVDGKGIPGTFNRDVDG